MSPTTSVPGGTKAASTPEVRERAVVRFAGDSGDGMQITGSRFTMETALAGSDLATFPDFPAEIRAPVGTTFGVSAFQIHFGSAEVATAGDDLGPAGWGHPHRRYRRLHGAQSPEGGVRQ